MVKKRRRQIVSESAPPEESSASENRSKPGEAASTQTISKSEKSSGKIHQTQLEMEIKEDAKLGIDKSGSPAATLMQKQNALR
eukprot:8141990-Karenia_brevis.AAC.1